jgi:hypothetical protein
MKYNETNMIVEDVLTDSEIQEVYQALQNNNGGAFVEPHCQQNYFIELPKHIVDKFTSHARSVSGNNDIVLTEYCYAIYKNTQKENSSYRPSLFPHYDETFKEPRFTFDYQLKSNIDWTIVVEPDKEFILKDNQAVTFSGTHQIHWRVPTIFNDDQYVEMIFCHFSDPNSGPKDSDVNDIMNEKASIYKKKFLDNGGFSNGGIA